MSAVPTPLPVIAVLMPAFDSARFVVRALDSLLAQSYTAWELAIVDDGSTDATPDVVEPYLADPRIGYFRHADNRGLGCALNEALDRTSAPYVAYLPADDVYYRDHLERLAATLAANDHAVLAHAHVRHHYSRIAEGPVDGHGLQLVQVLHRRSAERWLTRDELVTDDLARMYWSKLAKRGAFVSSGALTCEWVDHPRQRHDLERARLRPSAGARGRSRGEPGRRPLRSAEPRLCFARRRCLLARGRGRAARDPRRCLGLTQLQTEACVSRAQSASS